MRKVKILIINLLFMLLVSPLVVQAAGSINVSTRNININVGKSSSFTVSANNAAGRVDISTSNSGVASILAQNAQKSTKCIKRKLLLAFCGKMDYDI